MRTFEDPTEDLDKDLYKIFEDLQGSSKFLPISFLIFKILPNIFKFLHNSYQDLQGSSKGLQALARFKKIFKNLSKILLVLSRSTTIFEDH